MGLPVLRLMQLADEVGLLNGTIKIKDGDTIVVVSVSPAATGAGSTDSVYVHVVGREGLILIRSISAKGGGG